MAMKWADLKKKSKSGPIDLHDKRAANTAEGLRVIQDELYQRTIENHTKAMTWMTVLITLATIANGILWALK